MNDVRFARNNYLNLLILKRIFGIRRFRNFSHELAIAEKFEYLTATSADWTHEDLQRILKQEKK